MKLGYLACRFLCISSLLLEDKVWCPLDIPDLCCLQMVKTHHSQPTYELVGWGLDGWTDLSVFVLVNLSIPFKCIGSDVFCFYLQLILWMTKLLSLLVMPVKENNNSASDWLTLLARTLFRYLWSPYWISKENYSRFSPIPFRICTVVSLYLVFIAKDNKNKCISNPFYW